jgi:hypothetical protein
VHTLVVANSYQKNKPVKGDPTMIRVYHLKYDREETRRQVPSFHKLFDRATRGIETNPQKHIDDVMLVFLNREEGKRDGTMWYEHVADVATNDPEVAWRETNHIEGSWQDNPLVTVIGEPDVKHRSSSVGDVFYIVHEEYMCVIDKIGFTKFPVMDRVEFLQFAIEAKAY